MKLDTNTINKIAKLARIKLSEEEARDLLKDMNSILDWVEQLNEVNTDSVEPLANISVLTSLSCSTQSKIEFISLSKSSASSSESLIRASFAILFIVFVSNFNLYVSSDWKI